MYHTKPQTADILCCSISKLNRLMSERKISFYKLGGAVRFDDIHISDYLLKCEMKCLD